MSLQSVQWKDAREDFIKVNKELGGIIDRLNPDPSYTLYSATYPYGTYIIKDGVLQVPNKFGITTSITDHTVSEQLKNDLSYNLSSNPVFFVLQNTLEFFYILNEHTIPLYGLIPPGKMLGTWNVISKGGSSHGPIFLWNLTAGARSFFMLSKLSDTAGNKRLKKAFDLLTTNKPKTFLDQWDLLRTIVTHESIKNPWETKVIFFGKKWFDNLNDPAFRELQLLLFKNAWEGSNYFRHQFIWDLIYSVIQNRKNIKSEPHMINTVKHLITMSVGEAPGFVPAIDDFAGPVSLIKDIYRDIYQLKHYEPVMMHFHHFNSLENKPVYYSLNYPTSFNFSVRPTEEQSKIQDLISIKSVMTKFLDEIKHGQLKIDGTPVSQIPDNIQYRYIHSIEGFHQVDSIESILTTDPFFMKAIDGKIDRFPINSSFLKGCIQISSFSKNI